MNLHRFGLRHWPFSMVPDLRAYVPLPTHEAVLGGVSRAFTTGGGLALVDGDPGSGKSLVALRFAAGLPDGRSCVFIPSAKFARPTDLLQAVLFDLGAEYRGLSETELRLGVTDRLLAGLDQDAPTVIVLDEAQHLSDESLEEVRLLGNLTGRDGPASFILLVALPSLRERLAANGLASVAQRLSARCRLAPLTPEEATRFIRLQLAAAGGNAEALIDDEAAGVLAIHAGGSPRRLNQLAAAAFAVADEAEAEAVDVETALEACIRLGLADETKDEPTVLPLPAKPPASRSRAKKRKSA